MNKDKKLHLYAGFGIAALASVFFGYIIGVLAAVVAGAVKEIYDRATGKGTPEWADFLCTVGGAFLFVAVSVAVTLLFHGLQTLYYELVWWLFE